VIELIAQDKENFSYTMPLATSNLYNFIKKNNSSISQKTRYDIIKQIIEAMQFAHSKGILHRDISPNNILLFDDQAKLIVKVSDFGLGKDKKSLSHYTKSSVAGYGQILYVSPEQREKLNSATVKSDIYSLGKLVYFTFTGKDPDNQKPFELSSLVLKATEENPEQRFETLVEFKRHFKSLRDLMLNQRIPSEYVTLKDILKSEEPFSWLQFHNLVIEGKYLDHVYSDFLEPVFEVLSKKSNLQSYYQEVGSSVVDAFRKISERLHECWGTVGWPFSETKTIGSVLVSVAVTIPNSEIRLICLQHLWYLAFVMDQWAVQDQIKSVFNSKIISTDIQGQLSEFIVGCEKEISMASINSFRDIPTVVKSAIIRADKNAKEKEEIRQKELVERYGKPKW
jgi:serine/threonine protein kinase